MPRRNKKAERLERIEKTISALKTCSDLEQIAQIGQTEHDWLFSNYAASSAGTFISAEYIPAIEQAFPPSDGHDLLPHECWQKVNGSSVKRHKVVQTLKPTLEEWDERNQPTRSSTTKRINSKLPLDPEPLISEALEMLDSNKWSTLAASLILLTGRRPTEIAWCAQFEPHSDYSLIFSGQLKKGTIETLPFEIPTLISATQVFDAFQKLRQLQRNKTNILNLTTPVEATHKTNQTINQAVRTYFSRLLPVPHDRKGQTNRLSAGNLRAAYGKICEYFYCPRDAEPILYIGKILGHQCDNYDSESLATTIHYHTYRIVDKDGLDTTAVGIHLDRFPTGEPLETSPTSLESTKDDITFSTRKPITETVTTQTTAKPVTEIVRQPVTNKLDESVTETVTDKLTDNQSHNSLEPDLKPTSHLELSGIKLAQRLGVNKSTIGRNRKKSAAKFATWSQNLDPQGLAWKYTRTGKSPLSNRTVDFYLPINAPTIITNSTIDNQSLATKTTRPKREPVDHPTSKTVTVTEPLTNNNVTEIQRETTVVDNLENALSGTGLAFRLGVKRPTIGRNRDRGPKAFAYWTKKKDPENRPWKYHGKGQLGDSHHEVDIYLPLWEDEIEKFHESVVPSLTLTSSQLARIDALAQQLDFHGHPSLQLDLLLDTIENQLQTTPQPTTLNQNQQLITEASATIAQFSDHLNQTLTPLIQTLQLLVQRLPH